MLAAPRWTSRPRRCRVPAFVGLARKIRRHRAEIDNALDRGLSNALIESMSTEIRQIARTAYGFADPEALGLRRSRSPLTRSTVHGPGPLL